MASISALKIDSSEYEIIASSALWAQGGTEFTANTVNANEAVINGDTRVNGTLYAATISGNVTSAASANYALSAKSAGNAEQLGGQNSGYFATSANLNIISEYFNNGSAKSAVSSTYAYNIKLVDPTAEYNGILAATGEDDTTPHYYDSITIKKNSNNYGVLQFGAAADGKRAYLKFSGVGGVNAASGHTYVRPTDISANITTYLPDKGGTMTVATGNYSTSGLIAREALHPLQYSYYNDASAITDYWYMVASASETRTTEGTQANGDKFKHLVLQAHYRDSGSDSFGQIHIKINEGGVASCSAEAKRILSTNSKIEVTDSLDASRFLLVKDTTQTNTAAATGTISYRLYAKYANSRYYSLVLNILDNASGRNSAYSDAWTLTPSFSFTTSDSGTYVNAGKLVNESDIAGENIYSACAVKMANDYALSAQKVHGTGTLLTDVENSAKSGYTASAWINTNTTNGSANYAITATKAMNGIQWMAATAAPSFKSTITYAVGDTVVTGNKLYECTAASPAATWENASANFKQPTEVHLSANHSDITAIYNGLAVKFAMPITTNSIATATYLKINELDEYPILFEDVAFTYQYSLRDLVELTYYNNAFRNDTVYADKIRVSADDYDVRIYDTTAIFSGVSAKKAVSSTYALSAQKVHGTGTSLTGVENSAKSGYAASAWIEENANKLTKASYVIGNTLYVF